MEERDNGENWGGREKNQTASGISKWWKMVEKNGAKEFQNGQKKIVERRKMKGKKENEIKGGETEVEEGRTGW